MAEKFDWYPHTNAEQRMMYANIDVKIDGYQAKYSFLAENDYLNRIHAMCRTFIEVYDKIEYNRATARKATVWFRNILENKEGFLPAPVPQAYMPIVLPSGAFVGLERFCREFARLLKSQPNYERADGVDLMVEREMASAASPSEIEESQPEIKIRVLDTSVRVEWKKTGFDALELQYKKPGAAMWQAADKSTVSPFDFTPVLTQAGVPEKFEFRAVCLIRNERVGQWSPTYTLTVG